MALQEAQARALQSEGAIATAEELAATAQAETDRLR